MSDKRELILTRIHDVLKTVTAIETCARNRGLMNNDKRPALILLDGDENVQTSPPTRSNSAGLTPTINRLRPEIYMLLKEVRPNGEVSPGVTSGQRLNEYRMEITNKLATDATLLALLGSNGRLRYTGCVTDLKSGGALSGEMRLDFTFDYVFDPL